jgi:hypothetical protein
MQYDVTLLYDILQSVFCYATGIKTFREWMIVCIYMDGVLMYVRVKKELGPNTKIQIWNTLSCVGWKVTYLKSL